MKKADLEIYQDVSCLQYGMVKKNCLLGVQRQGRETGLHSYKERET